MEEQKEAQKSPLTSSRKLSSSLHNLTLNREQLNKNGERFAFKICSKMSFKTEFFLSSRSKSQDKKNLVQLRQLWARLGLGQDQKLAL